MQTQTTTGARPSRVAKFQVLSPDGFTIERDTPTYRSMKKAVEAFDKWKERYTAQGYYSTIQGGERVRIPLDELENYCQFNRI